MGSICGIYMRNGEMIYPHWSSLMMKKLSINPVGDLNAWQLDEVFLGNCLQYLTPDSLLEKLPYFHEPFNLVITSDVILDNREELYSLLGISAIKLEYLPDSILILHAYRKWGRECPKYLLGDFAFVIWDLNKREMFCAVDHTGNRTLYYYLTPRIFAFATLINPLFAVEEISHEFAEEWICDFLSIPSVIHQLDSELTIYRDVLMLPAGHSLVIGKDNIIKKVYWAVEKQQELGFKKDQDYEEAFRHVLDQAVKCRLRSKKTIGIMLSGGLDSASIACVAADELKKKNKQLHAFTSIPLAGFDGRDLPKSKVADETPYIETIRSIRKNIIFNYDSFPERHSLSDPDHYFTILEQPYKILENLFWIDGILANAQAQGIGVILTGGVGNTTISYGNILQCGQSLFKSGQWGRLIEEIRCYSKVKGKHPGKVSFALFKSLIPYELKKFIYGKRNLNWQRPFDLSIVNPIFAQQIKIKERYKRFNFDPFYRKRLDAFDQRKMMLAPNHLSHLGAIYTKIALSHNMIIRDPTIDKRVIEFCLSVPVAQFIRKGQDRSLVRRSMAGILPDKILLNDQVRGLQSGDFSYRLMPFKKEIYEEVMAIGQLSEEIKYLDLAKIHGKGKKLNLVTERDISDIDLKMLLRSIIFSRYLRFDKSAN